MCSREYLESPSVTEPSGLQAVTEAMLQRQQDQNENRLQLIASLKYVGVWEGTGNGDGERNKDLFHKLIKVIYHNSCIKEYY